MAIVTDVKLTDNSKEILDALGEKVNVALSAIGAEAEGFAKSECPVDTGRLRNSITYKVEGNDVYIGTNVEYAERVEYDGKMHHKVGNAHFLRNAAANHSERYKAILEAYMKQ